MLADPGLRNLQAGNPLKKKRKDSFGSNAREILGVKGVCKEMFTIREEGESSSREWNVGEDELEPPP